jgi:hypothetical protein
MKAVVFGKESARGETSGRVAKKRRGAAAPAARRRRRKARTLARTIVLVVS